MQDSPKPSPKAGEDAAKPGHPRDPVRIDLAELLRRLEQVAEERRRGARN